jgi:homoprotocatechuate degradation regulator HpaR
MRALDQSLPLKLLKARELVMERFRPHLHARGITDQQWRVLRALAEYSELDAGRLARLVVIKMPSLSRIMNDLERRGLVEKHASQADRRLVNLRITDEGRGVFAEMSILSETHYSGIEKVLGEADYKALLAQLDHLLVVLQPPDRL